MPKEWSSFNSRIIFLHEVGKGDSIRIATNSIAITPIFWHKTEVHNTAAFVIDAHHSETCQDTSRKKAALIIGFKLSLMLYYYLSPKAATTLMSSIRRSVTSFAGAARAGKEGHSDIEATLAAMTLATVSENVIRDRADTIIIEITLTRVVYFFFISSR